jgi:hypothetical protein
MIFYIFKKIKSFGGLCKTNVVVLHNFAKTKKNNKFTTTIIYFIFYIIISLLPNSSIFYLF